jgi:hypothetical protein
MPLIPKEIRKEAERLLELWCFEYNRGEPRSPKSIWVEGFGACLTLIRGASMPEEILALRRQNEELKEHIRRVIVCHESNEPTKELDFIEAILEAEAFIDGT